MNLKLTIIGGILILISGIIIVVAILFDKPNNNTSKNVDLTDNDHKILSEYQFIKQKECDINKLALDIDRTNGIIKQLKQQKNKSAYDEELYINLQKNLLIKKSKYNEMALDYNAYIEVFTNAYSDTKIFNDSIIFVPQLIRPMDLKK